MANDYVKNFVYGNISVAPSPASSGTSLSLADADAALFPDPATVGAYDVVVWPTSVKPSASNAEIVRITAKASPSGGNTAFTITRQQQSTSARTIVVGDQVAMNLTAKTITDIIGMGTSSLVRNEVPSGSVNSSNTAFTTAAAFQTGSLRVYQNGIRLKGGGVDYTEGSSAFTMAVAPVTGDIILVDYETNTTSFATGSTSFINNDVPSGTINGSNTAFTLAYTPVSGTLRIERDGQGIYETDDWTLSGANITFVTAPATGSKLRAFYQKSLSVAGNADTLDGYHANATPTAGQIPVLNSKSQLPYPDGWTPVGETWTYASATTITVPSGAASRYIKGDKMKLTQTTVKYFYIIGVADTTLTITGGADYTLTNATITDNYYSHETSPVGFPNTFSLGTPTWTGHTVNFTNQPTSNSCYFWVVGNICHIKILALTHATSGGTGIFSATFTTGYLPNVNDASGSAFNLSSPQGGYSYTQSANNNKVYMANWNGTTLAGNNAYFEAYICFIF